MSVNSRSVDPADVARFEKLSARWWDSKGPMKALHRINPVRVAWLRERMCAHFPDCDPARPLAGLSILDIGCGAGLLSEALAALGATVTGIDAAPGNIAMARAHAEGQTLALTYEAVSAEALAARGRAFDVVCVMEVVEHVIDMPAFVATAASLVRPGGMLFAATINRTLKSFALAIVGAEYVLNWVPRGTHQWEKFVTPAELAAALRPASVTVSDQTGVTFQPLLNLWRTSRDMDVNYMLAGVRKDATSSPPLTQT